MEKSETNVIVRFAPSPTGPLHVGGVRSALFNYLYARQHNGKLILRIEDTDTERSKPEYEKDILEGFKWLSIEFDETFKQSDRIDIHKKYLQKLIDSDRAYVSKEEPSEIGKRSEVIRFRNTNQKVVFDDLIKGHIEFDTTELGDFVIAKSMNEPLFHLAVVVDDFEMGITHVIRGEDHISNTPRQILIQEAIGASRPLYGHIPLILSTDRSKLSKRKHGERVSLKFYREQGYLPETLINYLAFLGWNPGDDRELFSKEDLIKEFQLEKVQKSGAIFSVEKLNWMNREYLLKKPKTEIGQGIEERFSIFKKFTELAPWQKERLALGISDRIHFYGEVSALIASGDLEYVHTMATYQKESLLWSKKPDAKDTKKHLETVVKTLGDLSEQATLEKVRSAIFPYAEANGKGSVLWPLRFALTGKERSLDPFTVISILGIAESTRRLTKAIDLLQ